MNIIKKTEKGRTKNK